jgi:pyrrolidone-carboxylate peptidase
MRKKIFAALDKINPSTENIKSLSLEAVRTATVPAAKLPF